MAFFANYHVAVGVMQYNLKAITYLLFTIPNRRTNSRRTNVLACVISTFENSSSKETAAAGKENSNNFCKHKNLYVFLQNISNKKISWEYLQL